MYIINNNYLTIVLSIIFAKILNTYNNRYCKINFEYTQVYF